MPFYHTDGKIKFNQFEHTNEKKTWKSLTILNFISVLTILILNNLFFLNILLQNYAWHSVTLETILRFSNISSCDFKTITK